MTETPHPPAAPPAPLKGALDAALERARREEEPFGRRLMVLGTGPLPVTAGEGAAVALDPEGRTILVVALSSLSPASGAEIADELDRLAQLSEKELESLEEQPGSRLRLSIRHAAFFKLGRERRPRSLNRKQQAIVVVSTRPSVDDWQELVMELGPRLQGVYLAHEGTLEALPVPEALGRRRRAARGSDWSLADWITLTAVVVGLALALIGLTGVFRPDVPEESAAAGAERQAPDRSQVANVAVGVPPEATHNQWIGQERVARTSTGGLVAVYPMEQGVAVVSDDSNHGRSWQTPSLVDDVRASSLAVAVDADDNLHVAFQGQDGLGYALMTRSDGEWTAGEVLPLDDDATSAVVDVTWDGDNELAHVVWADQTPDGERPYWAAVSTTTGTPERVQGRPLGRAGEETNVLVNIAAADGVIATYRRGDRPSAWFSRSATADADGRFSWDEEEEIRSGGSAGAAALAVDRRGTAHLVLREDTHSKLEYFTRSQPAGWSDGTTAAQGDSVEDVDLPFLSIDDSSSLVYVFFQSGRFREVPEVLVAIRDPASGWEGPYQAAAENEVPEGALYPTSLSILSGQPVVLWTIPGPTPAVQAGRVAP